MITFQAGRKESMMYGSLLLLYFSMEMLYFQKSFIILTRICQVTPLISTKAGKFHTCQREISLVIDLNLCCSPSGLPSPTTSLPTWNQSILMALLARKKRAEDTNTEMFKQVFSEIWNLIITSNAMYWEF